MQPSVPDTRVRRYLIIGSECEIRISVRLKGRRNSASRFNTCACTQSRPQSRPQSRSRSRWRWRSPRRSPSRSPRHRPSPSPEALASPRAGRRAGARAPGARAGDCRGTVDPPRRRGDRRPSLEPARDTRPIPAGKRIHVVGAGGAAGAAACFLAHAVGARASGATRVARRPTRRRSRMPGSPCSGATIPPTWRAARPRSSNRLAVTKALTSVHPDHRSCDGHVSGDCAPDQRPAADRGCRGDARRVADRRGGNAREVNHDRIADPPAHGRRPRPIRVGGRTAAAALVGGSRPSTVRLGAGSRFVVEADEYAGNFDPYRPAIGVLTNADWDHPDVFRDRAAVVAAFVAWIVPSTGAGLIRSSSPTPATPVSARSSPACGTGPAGWSPCGS